MNRHLKKRIQKAFKAPEPDWQEKRRFLNTLPQSRISLLQFVFIQAAYLRKRTLLLSVLLAVPGIMGLSHMEPGTLWGISAMVPFLGLVAVAESARSRVYGMEEFEMSTRFSLKSVMLARMSVLGVTDAMILCLLALGCCIGSGQPYLPMGIYLFVPYLLTVNISLWMIRHLGGREALYACSSVAVLVSAIIVGLFLGADFIYQPASLKWWIGLFLLLAGAMIYEAYRTIKQTEEWVWNL